GTIEERRLAVEPRHWVPAQRRESEQRQHDNAQKSLAGKQGDDLIGAGKAEMGSTTAWDARDIALEQPDRAPVRLQFAGDQVEQRGLPGAVPAHDQTPLAGPGPWAH